MNEDIQIYDCIEFNKRFRYADVLCDASFLAMDIQMRGYADLADRYTRVYLSGTGQSGTEPLYNFYSCYHAVVRGKVEGFRSEDPNITDEESQSGAENARRYFKLADKMKERMPTFKIEYKDESSFMKTLGKVLFFNKRFSSKKTLPPINKTSDSSKNKN